MNERSVLVVVPARGGSKGLPRKNLRPLGGLPLIGWSLAAAQQVGLGARCLLSTDDEELAAVGLELGFDVPFRRKPELATDQASLVPVVLDAVDWVQAMRGEHIEWVVLLQPTSPFRPPAAIREALAKLTAGAEAVAGVKAIHRSLSGLYVADEKMRLLPLGGGEAASRRQDVRTLYTPNGALYALAVEVLRQQATFFPAGLVGLPMGPIASIDIDDAEDFALAEAVVAAGLATVPRR